MRLQRIVTIYRKDLRDAIRDARVLMAVLTPLGLGLLYNVIFSDTSARTKTTVAYTMSGDSVLPETLRSDISPRIDISYRVVTDPADVRDLVEREVADVGLVIPAGFDEAVRHGGAPELTVILPESASFGADYVAAVLEPTVRRMAGQTPPATITADTIPAAEINATGAIYDQLGIRRWMVLFMAILLVAMIAVYAVPVILTEETDRKTLDALGMIASYADVIAAKALVGLTYVAVALPTMPALTRLRPADPLMFAAAVALFSVVLVGVGLLLGGLFRTANQLNSWSSIVLLLVIFPAALVGLPVPRVLALLAEMFPTGHAARLTINGVMGRQAFGDAWLSFTVIAAWGVAAYAVLLWRMSRREAQ
jgi:ABC-2 type transport system permease protein